MELERNGFLNIHKAIINRIILLAAWEVGCQEITSKHIKEINELVLSKGTGAVNLPGNLMVKIYQSKVWFGAWTETKKTRIL